MPTVEELIHQAERRRQYLTQKKMKGIKGTSGHVENAEEARHPHVNSGAQGDSTRNLASHLHASPRSVPALSNLRREGEVLVGPESGQEQHGQEPATATVEPGTSQVVDLWRAVLFQQRQLDNERAATRAIWKDISKSLDGLCPSLKEIAEPKKTKKAKRQGKEHGEGEGRRPLPAASAAGSSVVVQK